MTTIGNSPKHKVNNDKIINNKYLMSVGRLISFDEVNDSSSETSLIIEKNQDIDGRNPHTKLPNLVFKNSAKTHVEKSENIIGSLKMSVQEFISRKRVRKRRKAKSQNEEEKKESPVKPHTCPICERSFKLLFHLKAHAKSHFDSSNVICERCGKTFHNKGSLNLHMRTHKFSNLWEDKMDRNIIPKISLQLASDKICDQQKISQFVAQEKSKTEKQNELMHGIQETNFNLKNAVVNEISLQSSFKTLANESQVNQEVQCNQEIQQNMPRIVNVEKISVNKNVFLTQNCLLQDQSIHRSLAQPTQTDHRIERNHETQPQNIMSNLDNVESVSATEGNILIFNDTPIDPTIHGIPIRLEHAVPDSEAHKQREMESHERIWFQNIIKNISQAELGMQPVLENARNPSSLSDSPCLAERSLLQSRHEVLLWQPQLDIGIQQDQQQQQQQHHQNLHERRRIASWGMESMNLQNLQTTSTNNVAPMKSPAAVEHLYELIEDFFTYSSGLQEIDN